MLHKYHLGKSPNEGALNFRKCKYSFANPKTLAVLIAISFYPAFNIIATRIIFDDRFICFAKPIDKTQVENSVVPLI